MSTSRFLQVEPNESSLERILISPHGVAKTILAHHPLTDVRWMGGSTVHFPARAPKKFRACRLFLTRRSRRESLALGRDGRGGLGGGRGGRRRVVVRLPDPRILSA